MKYLEGLGICHFCHKELYENLAGLRVFQTEKVKTVCNSF